MNKDTVLTAHAQNVRQKGRKPKVLQKIKTVINRVLASAEGEQILNYTKQSNRHPKWSPTGQNELETLNILTELIRSAGAAEFTTALKVG